jgi:hypothetical protein
VWPPLPPQLPSHAVCALVCVWGGGGEQVIEQIRTAVGKPLHVFKVPATPSWMIPDIAMHDTMPRPSKYQVESCLQLPIGAVYCCCLLLLPVAAADCCSLLECCSLLDVHCCTACWLQLLLPAVANCYCQWLPPVAVAMNAAASPCRRLLFCRQPLMTDGPYRTQVAAALACCILQYPQRRPVLSCSVLLSGLLWCATLHWYYAVPCPDVLHHAVLCPLDVPGCVQGPT